MLALLVTPWYGRFVAAKKLSNPKYGLGWPDDCDAAQIERTMLQNGGYIRGKGNGLLFHFKAYWAQLWPDDAQTKWTDLVLKEVLENQFVSIIGPGSSWKSGTISRIGLMDWSLFPECTYILVSSTDMDSLRGRIFADFQKQWSAAFDRFEWFPGHSVDHKTAIVYEDVQEDLVRDMRNAIIGVPCKTSNGAAVGMGKFVGRKNRRVWAIADEVQFTERSFLEAQENLSSNGPNLLPGYYPMDYPEVAERGRPMRGYRGVFVGNPNPTRPENTLHVVSEPEGGWNSIPDDSKTRCWTARQVPGSIVKCRVINLDGRDSPNSDYPYGKPRWPQLIHAARLDKFSKDSEGYWSQGVGVVRLGLAGSKVVTKELCDQFHAGDGVIWKGDEPNVHIGALDAAYGGVGGDRCVLLDGEFGECIDGVVRLLVHTPIIVPVRILPNQTPEDQITTFCRNQMTAALVKPENFFFDGRGGIGLSFSRVWTDQVNVMEFGGRPTERPVGHGVDSMTEDVYGNKRPKTAREFYSKFVSELWWSCRLAIESNQIRGLSNEIIYDGQPREWSKVGGDKIEIETKKEMKKRTGESPDLFDAFAILLEGARRRGFKIAQLGEQKENSLESRYDWLDKMADERAEIRNAQRLQLA